MTRHEEIIMDVFLCTRFNERGGACTEDESKKVIPPSLDFVLIGRKKL